MIIYKATNKISGKMYIGQTIHSLDYRKKKHIYDASIKIRTMYFHKAIRKYGADGFDWEVIHTCSDRDELNRLEVFYIGFYNTFNNGYNLNEGGSNACCSEATKKKMSEASNGEKNPMWGRKGKDNPSYGKSGNGTPMWGKNHSEVTKKKISDAQSGKKHRMFGKHHSIETKKKMSDSHKCEKNYWFGKSLSENHKKNMSKAQSGEKSHRWGKRLSDETKEKISKANVGRRHSAEAKKKMAKAHLGICPANARQVMISGTFFESLTSAGKFVGVSRDSIASRIKHKVKWMDYKYA